MTRWLLAAILGALLLVPSWGDAQAVLVTDDFQRTNLSPWTIYYGDVGIVNGTLGMRSKIATLPMKAGIVAWSGTLFGPDQFSEGTLGAIIDSNAMFQVFVRRRVSDLQRYGFHWNRGNGTWAIKRDGGPAAPTLVSVPGVGPVAGDVLRVEVRGSVIVGYHNGVPLLTATDGVLLNGEPGAVLHISQVTVFPMPGYASWRAGSLP